MSMLPLYEKELKVKIRKGMEGIKELAIRCGRAPADLLVVTRNREPMKTGIWPFRK